ncbi:hypothetical protein HMI54_014871 [Coelomomyces lativittatus]|nr:hypothetical protein HMI54_014871 [Coelomomyces lativittatus]
MITLKQIRIIIALATAGAMVGPILGLAASAAVPWAMSTFGTVVPGLGTLHVPLISGGFAAILQSLSAALLSIKSVFIGAGVGTILGLIYEFFKWPPSPDFEKKNN